MKILKALLVFVFASTSAQAQNYGVMQWGINKAASPYQFGTNINGTWSNLGTVSSTGVWSLNGSANVTNFGLIGATSATDYSAAAANTTAIQNAVNYTAALGLTLIIPPTPYFYAINGNVLIPSNTTIVGQGNPVFKLNSGRNTWLFYTPNTNGSIVNNVSITGIGFDGNKTNNLSGVTCIIISNQSTVTPSTVSGIFLRNNTISNCGDAGITFSSAFSSTPSSAPINNVIVDSNEIYGSKFGTSGAYLTNFRITNNYIHDNTNGGISFGGSGGVVDSNISSRALSTTFTGAASDGITAYDPTNSNIVVSNNYVFNGANGGIHLGGDNVSVVGNIVNTTQTAGGISIKAGYPASSVTKNNAVVSGNTVINAQLHGIAAQAVDGISITGNSVYGSIGALAIIGIKNAEISGNNFSNNTTTAVRFFADSINEANPGVANESMNVSIQNNTINNNVNYGIQIGYADIIKVSDNVISNNLIGVALDGAPAVPTNITLVGNDLTNNTTAVNRPSGPSFVASFNRVEQNDGFNNYQVSSTVPGVLHGTTTTPATFSLVNLQTDITGYFNPGVGIGIAANPTINLYVRNDQTNLAANYFEGYYQGTHTLTSNNANALTGSLFASFVNQNSFNATNGSGAAIGVTSQARATGASGTVSNVVAVAANPGNTGAGTVTNLFGYQSNATNSGGGTVTNYYGFYQPATTVGTNNYGFFSANASGSGRWNFYASGTANNAFAGNARFGGVTAPVYPVDVTGSVDVTGAYISTGTNPTATGAGGTCAAGAVTGGATVGTVALTAACASTNTLALTSMPTVLTGYVCDAADRTNGVLNLVQTSTTTTGATFTFNATTGATDVIQFKCMGY